MNTIYTPYFPIHPGEMLKDELSARGIKQKQFAEVIGVSYSLLNEVLNCKRPISADLALAVEAALGIKAYIWVNQQAEYNLQIASRDQKTIDRMERIRSICASLL